MSGGEPCVKRYADLVLSVQLKPATEILVHLHSNGVARVHGRRHDALLGRLSVLHSMYREQHIVMGPCKGIGQLYDCI